MSDPAITDYLPPQCEAEGCEELGPFQTEDGPRCFTHSPAMAGFPIEHAPEALAQAMDEAGMPVRKRRRKAAPADDMNDTASRALAALILQATADALTADPAIMERAIIQLAADLPAPLEVAAGILFATTAISGTAGLTDQEVFVIGAAFEDQAETESAQPTTDDGPTVADEPQERGDDEQDGTGDGQGRASPVANGD